MGIKIRFFLAIVLFCLATQSYAAAEGFYAGVQLGISNTHNNPQTIYYDNGTPATPTPVSPTNTGLGGRFFGGYNFNQYAAYEMGYTHYAPSTYSVPTSVAVNNPAIRTNSFDLEGKGMFTIGAIGLGVFGKAGLALITTGQSGILQNSAANSSSNGNTTSVRPLIGLGVSYDLSQNWVTDLSWTRVLSGGGIKSADLIAIGFSYHWVDKYCGQFLC